MKKLSAALLIYLGLASAALAQTPGGVPSTMATIPIAGTVATSTRIITGNASKQIYVTALGLIPAATSVVTLTAGTGTNCGTNTTSLTGAMTFTTQAPFFYGSGYGAVLVLPKGYDLCITIATAAAPGTLAYAQY
jgi:hypothetical protein